MAFLNRALVVVLIGASVTPLAASCGGTGGTDDNGNQGACSGASCVGGSGGSSAGQGGAHAGSTGASGASGKGVGGASGKGGTAGASGASAHAGSAGSLGVGGGGGSAGKAGGSGSAGVGGASGHGGAAGTAGLGGAGGTGGKSTGGSSGASGTGGSGGNGNSAIFPALPIIDGNAPANSATLFPNPGGDPTGGPCLFEPEDDSLYPDNWLRPRFSFTPGAGENLFEIRMSAPGQMNELVVYTDASSWTMPKPLWMSVSAGIIDIPITVTVRGGVLSGGSLTGTETSMSTTYEVAPSQASGTVVYWTTTDTALKGFSVGQEDVTPVLVPSQVQMGTVGGSAVTCIGCHTSTPDGLYAAFTAQGPWGNVLAAVKPPDTGKTPSFLGAGALATFQSQAPLGIETFSKAHWANGDHVEVAPLGDGNNSLVWIDLEATTSGMGTSYGAFARNGDSNGAGTPTWSHDGNTIVYVSTNASVTGRLDNGAADLFSIPYANRAGGDAKGIPGASDPNVEEYYPAYSADDELLAFNVIPNGNNMYSQDLAELYVIPPSGGTKTRLKANDPAACTGKASPGTRNSWAKWSPEVEVINGKSYYWMIFSSTRAGSVPQLYMTGVTVDGAGTVETHGSVYLWNQPATESNHTPAWDVFDIKP